jgi:uncharacterized protein YfdQ (DUF2303 family)
MSDQDADVNNYISARDLGAALAEQSDVDGHPFVIVPNGYKLEDLERFKKAPFAIAAIVTLQTLDGLITYVEKFKGNGTAIFIGQTTGQTTAVLDYDEPAAPAWRRHWAKFNPAFTVEWKRWIEKNEIWQDQRTFAEFIENNVADITKPSGADMLEIASTLEAKTAVEFKSGVRLDNGTHRLTFAAETVAKAGDKGALEIPQQFELALEPFIGGDAYPLTARFRYKITDGKLTLRYQLVNPHKVLESAVADIITKIGTGTGITPFIGTAP